jgi:2-(1,2-epoxy-1,2-dihydrophenyl)acetyl-CoA isomerase
MSECILAEVKEGVGTLTLNRPSVLNALNADMARALPEVLARVASDEAVRCVVIRGAGSHFMAGGDVKFFREALGEFEKGADPVARIIGHVQDALRTLRGMGKPVLASVQGAAAGFGLSLMAACDLAIAADDATFTLAYCHIGASPDGGATYFLPRMVGFKRAMELVLLGERFDAQHALSIGLINRVVPASELAGATHRLAQQLVAGPRHAYAKSKALINGSMDATLAEQLDAEQSAFLACSKTQEFAEGVTAFCEKRKPRFGDL